MNTALRMAVFALWLGGCALASAQPLTAAALQQRLQQSPKHLLRFTEVRESPWLAAPVQSSGTMRATPTLLEKRIEQPQRETWRILPDRMQRTAPSGATQELLFGDAPALAALANALRDVMAGDLAALAKDFRLVVAGDAHLWTVQLTPRAPEVARTLAQLELQGSQDRLLVLVVLERGGERTTTRLFHE